MRSKFKWIFTLLVALSMQFSFAQEKTVTGTVTDGKLPLPAANIKGAKGSVAADVDGKFSINAKPGDVLVVTYQGYESKSITVGAANSYKVSLKENAKVLEDVLINTSVGIKKKKDAVTSASQVLSSKEIGQAGNPDVVQALAGKVSGLQVNVSSTSVNSDTRIVLRGTRTITGNSQALVVIDDAISSATILSQIPAELIDNINVMKGASGAALYGELGSNGVIIVTTKKGSKSSKPIITFNSSIDFTSVLFTPKEQQNYGQGYTFSGDNGENFLGATGILHTAFTPIENTSWGPAFNDPAYLGQVLEQGIPLADGSFRKYAYAPVKDNIKKFFKTGSVSQIGGSINMGNEDGYALFSYNKLNNDFVVKDDNYKKNTFSFKGGKKLGKFNVSGGATFINASTSQTTNVYNDLLQTPTNVDPSNYSSGSYYDNWSVWMKSPYWLIKNVRYDDLDNTFVGNASLSYELNKHISTRITGNTNMYDNIHTYHNDGINLDYSVNMLTPYQLNGDPNFDINSSYWAIGNITSSYYRQNTKTNTYYGDWIVNFNYELTKDLNLKANAGLNWQDNMTTWQTTGGYGLVRPGIYTENNLTSPNGVYVGSPSNNNDYFSSTPGEFLNGSVLLNYVQRSRKAAGFGNVDLSYKNYLFLNATSRIEKSSVIKSSQFYPSVGVSFIPTKALSALADNSVLNYLKLYGSYVKTGNSSTVSAYQTYGERYSTALPYTNSGISYTYGTSQIDPNIKPEFVTTYEVGFNSGFFKDRITLGASFYKSNTDNLINNTSTSRASGITSWLSNIGSLENKGMELDLGLAVIRNANFKWNLNTNFTKFDTKVLSLADGAPYLNVSGYGYGNAINSYAIVGESFPSLQGIGFLKDADGHVIVDGNGIPKKTASIVNLGKVTPDFIIGLNNSFEYKGLKFTTVVDYRQGGKFYSAAKQQVSFAGNDGWQGDFDRNAGYVWPNSVTTTGAVNTTPINYANFVAANSNGIVGNQIAEQYVVDATAIRVRELVLGYTLPSKFSSSIGVKSLYFSVNARNPFVWFAKSNQNYSDPESSGTSNNGQGISTVDRYPNIKSYGFAINLTF